MKYKNEQKLIIEGELPDLNTYISSCRGHYIKGAKIKKDGDWMVEVCSKQQKLRPVPSSCFIEYHWYCKNRKKDKSNISSMGRKCIEDGLQSAGILQQDSWEAIIGFSDMFYLDKDNPRIEIIIKY